MKNERTFQCQSTRYLNNEMHFWSPTKDPLKVPWQLAVVPSGRPKLRFKNVMKRSMMIFNISPDEWQSIACNHYDWRAAPLHHKNIIAQSYINAYKRCRSHSRSHRHRPWWWMYSWLNKALICLVLIVACLLFPSSFLPAHCRVSFVSCLCTLQ